MVRVLVLAMAMLLAACSPSASPTGAPAGPAVRIESVVLTPTPGGRDISAGYLTIRNVGAAPDTLLSVSSAVAGRIDIHETRMNADGVMQMFPIAGGVTIPAGGAVTFAPGGLHLMLMDLAAPLQEGERATVTLVFSRSGAVQADAIVQRPGADAHGH